MAAHYAELAYRENIAARNLRGSGFVYAARYESWASATMFWLDTDKNYLIFFKVKLTLNNLCILFSPVYFLIKI